MDGRNQDVRGDWPVRQKQFKLCPVGRCLVR